jgi:hypothetical protein
MRGGVLVLVLIGSLAATAASFAQEPSSVSAISRRQIASCMSRRMAADRLLSFNDAAKACKDQLKSRKADTAANVATKPVS